MENVKATPQHDSSYRSAIPVSPATRDAWLRAMRRAQATCLDERVRMSHDSLRVVPAGDREIVISEYWCPSTSDPDAEYALTLTVDKRPSGVATIACSCDAAIHGHACIHGAALILDMSLDVYLNTAR